jgi:hypothetical protein
MYFDVMSSTLNGTAMDGLNSLKIVGSSAVHDGVRSRTLETRITSHVVLWNNQARTPAYPAGLSKTLAPSQLSTTGFPCEPHWGVALLRLLRVCVCVCVGGGWLGRCSLVLAACGRVCVGGGD